MSKKPLQDLDQELIDIARSLNKDSEKLVKKACNKISKLLKEHDLPRINISQDLKGYQPSSEWGMSKTRVIGFIKSHIDFASVMLTDSEEFKRLRDV